MWRLTIALCLSLLAADVRAATRALLVGINDYTASRLGKPATTLDRDWANLNGAVADVELLKQMLVLVYGVDPGAIVTLTDQAATRAAIIEVLESMAAGAKKGDVVLFYFAGHGSQVTNSKSDERDRLDESIVPADSRLGVRDIRDKELRRYFNAVLDRGARLTVLLDSCHSGSGARGLATGARARAIRRDPRDVADGRPYGPKPENRGALVITAAEDTGEAREMRAPDGQFHGVFSWAWVRSLREASSGEPTVDTFYRAQARMRTEPPFQSPVIAGKPEAKLAPFLGTRIDRRGDRTVIAVGRVNGDSVVLRGGWANGLWEGTELREPKSAARLKITAVQGLSQSVARLVAGSAPATGALAEVVGWAAPPGPPLRVSMPRAARSLASITSFARTLNDEVSQRGIRWIANPIDSTPSRVLRWSSGAWQLLFQDGHVEQVGGDDAAIAAVGRMAPGTSLFVQLPAPAAMAGALDIVSAPAADADYILVGRYSGRRVKYAWLRPLVRRRDKRRTPMPLQTAWTVSAPDLQKALLRLRRIYGWQTLESPPEARFPYHLRIRRARDQWVVREGESVVGDTTYKLVLGRAMPVPPKVKPRYIYAFIVDSAGKSTLLFPPPEAGSVENHLPDRGVPVEIALEGSAFQADEPYGIDTYVLLTTDEPLPNPAILEWDGVRAPQWHPKSALEQLLALTAAGTRGATTVTPASWSIERVSYESVRSRATKIEP